MVNIVLIALGVLLIKYREKIADMIGFQEWMRYVGGVYNFVVIVGIFLFLFGIARLTGTVDILLAPIYSIIPKGAGQL